MLHVDIPSRSDIERLVSVRDPACVSIYLRTTPLTQEAQGDRIELKTLGRDALDQLRGHGADRRSVAAIQEAVDDLVDDHEISSPSGRLDLPRRRPGMYRMESAARRETMSRIKEPTARTVGALRTFRVPGLEGETGRVVLEVDEQPVYAVDVESGTATLSTAAAGPARVTVNFESRGTLDEVVEGRLHPIVAGLQSRFTEVEGDRRFGLSVLLALRASAPIFAEGRC